MRKERLKGAKKRGSGWVRLNERLLGLVRDNQRLSLY